MNSTYYFDHEKLHVYQAALAFASFAAGLCKELRGENRNARDQLIRASQSIPLNIAEGNGKRSSKDRKRFLEIANGSAMECAAILDVLVHTDACSPDNCDAGKRLLVRIVSMLVKMTEPDGPYVREDADDYEGAFEYENEYENEYDQGIPREKRI